MRIALVDDDAVQLQNLKAMLQEALQQRRIDLQCLDTFSDPRQFLTAWEPGKYDILLLDIYMDTHNGVQIARQIREADNEVVLAFCTSSNEFASESYEVGASYYLQKPISPEKLGTMLKRLDLGRIERGRTLCLPDGFKCLLRQIAFTEYTNHTVCFHFLDGSTHSLYMSHAEAEKLLLHYKQFCGINKGCIVSFAAVKRASGGEFLMENGQRLPISRRRLKDVMDAYTQYRFEKMDGEV